MTGLKDKLPSLSNRNTLGIGAALLLALGAAGGAGAVSLTRPAIEMAPLNATPINKLGAASGVVTVKGKVAEIFGDRLVVQDQSGRAMIDIGRASETSRSVGQVVTVQGRFDDGVLHASYLIDPDGRVTATGPAGGPHGPGGPGHPRPDGPPAPGGRDRAGAMPPPPGDCSALAPMPRLPAGSERATAPIANSAAK